MRKTKFTVVVKTPSTGVDMDKQLIDDILKASGSRRESVMAALHKHDAFSPETKPIKPKKKKAKE